MIKYAAVLPFIYQPYFDECIKTLRMPDENLLVIDNINNPNLGVAGSWNLGIRFMEDIGADWLIIISATMRFGELGGMDMLKQLEEHTDTDIVHFAGLEVPEQPYIRGKTLGVADNIFGWWLTAIHRRVIDKVGKFDTNFHPIYFEDLDYDWRINKDYPEHKWLVLPIDAKSTSIGHGVKLGGVVAPAQPNIDYFVRKWGRNPEGSYARSFN